MPENAVTPKEARRLAALMRCRVMDTDPEPAFDAVTRLASSLCGTPIALISLLDSGRQWFKSRVGLEAEQTPREVAFCDYTIDGTRTLVILDAREDARTRDNPLVTGAPHIRFYAGAPLALSTGETLGTLCVIDVEPREWTPKMEQDLSDLALQAAALLELRHSTHELNQAMGELRDKNEEMDRFVHIASHDLKSPLLTIEGFAGWLQRDIDEGRHDRLDQFVRRIQEGTTRMRTNIDDLLELSRVGRVTQEMREVRPSALLSELASQMDTQLSKAGAVVRIADDIPVVTCDPGRLRQVFENLLGNTLKYGQPDEGEFRITMGGATHGNEVRLFISDNGGGVPPEYREKVFGLFERLQSEGDGTGIGLAIVKRVAEVHGGRAWVEDTAGGGATFVVALPCQPAVPRRANAA